MKKYNDNPIAYKSKAFALRCMKLYRILCDKKEFVVANQLLRSGTSIGANIREALEGASKADFGYKMNIALKETSESGYWLELLHEDMILTDKEFTSIYNDCEELYKMLSSIVKTTFENDNT